MISLRLLLLVLLTLGCREWAEGNPQVAPMWAGLAVVGVALGFGLLFKVSALRVLTSGGAVGASLPAAGRSRVNADDVGFAGRCERARQLVEGAWLVFLPLALLATGWGPALNSLQSAGLPQVVAMLGWFLPSLVLIVLLELTAAQLDELCHSQLQPRSPHSHHSDLPVRPGVVPPDNTLPAHSTWPREWLLRMRLGPMASLITCLTPLLLMAAATDLVRAYGWDVHGARMVFAASLIAIGCVVLFLPVWLGKWMGVTEFPKGELRQRIESQLSGLQLHGIGLRLLPSEGRWPGAAIVGWFPRCRQMWLGDALIERLTPQQLDMVIMHELAHVTGWHFLWRVFPMSWAAGVAVLFGACWPAAEELRWLGLLMGGTLACIVMLVGMSLMAHQCELEADLSACRLAQRVCDWTHDQPTQLAVQAAITHETTQKSNADGTGPQQTRQNLAGQTLARSELAGALLRLLGDSPQAAAMSWLHPSLQQRLKNLRCRR